MCYDIQQLHERQITHGVKWGYPADQLNLLIDSYNKRFSPQRPIPRVHYAVSAFEHPEIGVLHVKDGKLTMEPMVWGLIPFWTKDQTLAHKLWNQTANARSETMFEKPSFRAAARKKRGIIVIDSFFEHHHFKGKTYPFNVRYKDGKAMVAAVLWDEWTDRSTGEVLRSFSIVTTHGNEMMAVLHNSPKLKEPRMPVFLEGDDIECWLKTQDSEDNHLSLLPLCRPLSEEALTAHSVQALRCKKALGNVPEAAAPFVYKELEEDEKLMAALGT